MRMRYLRILYRDGAILLEIMISVIILAVGLTGVIRSFFVGIQACAQTQEYMTAAVLLDNKLTELLAGRYFDPTMADAGGFDDPFSLYRYEVSAEPLEGSEFLNKVKVKIFWPGPQEDRFLDAETYLFSRQADEGEGL